MVGLILAAARFGMITESAGASADFRKNKGDLTMNQEERDFVVEVTEESSKQNQEKRSVRRNKTGLERDFLAGSL